MKEIESKEAAVSIKKTIGSLFVTTQTLSELRNLHGTGHGKNAKAKSLGSRHAALPVNAAAALALYLYQSHKKKTKPKEVELRKDF